MYPLVVLIYKVTNTNMSYVWKTFSKIPLYIMIMKIAGSYRSWIVHVQCSSLMTIKTVFWSKKESCSFYYKLHFHHLLNYSLLLHQPWRRSRSSEANVTSVTDISVWKAWLQLALYQKISRKNPFCPSIFKKGIKIFVITL